MNVQLPSVRRHVRQPRRYRQRVAAFTLVEMLVAMAITLILITALAQAYAVLGQALAEGRATIEMAGSFRFVAHRLQDDLDRVTVAVRPPVSEASGMGYFEILDGPITDWTSSNITSLSMFGDVDDVLAFTARRDESPFIGEFNYQPVESELAEMVWWIQNESGSDSLDEPFAIYRRVLLIRPDYDVDGPGGLDPGVLAQDSLTGSATSTFEAGYNWLRDRLTNPAYPTSFQRTDLSIRPHWDFIRLPNGQIRMEVSIRTNSLADLTDRRNRFVHWKIPPNWNREKSPMPADGDPFGFPYRLETTTGDFPLYGSRKIGDQFGDDLMLWNVLGFDVEVFDPNATTRNRQIAGDDVEALVPSDPGYTHTSFSQFPVDPRLRRGRGVFADLGYGDRRSPIIAPHAPFHGAPHSLSQLAVGTYYTYCTWSRRYEQFTSIDPNFDYDGSRFTDTPQPPYSHALRGVQVRLRAWEPDYRQVRQKTVVSHFVVE